MLHLSGEEKSTKIARTQEITNDLIRKEAISVVTGESVTGSVLFRSDTSVTRRMYPHIYEQWTLYFIGDALRLRKDYTAIRELYLTITVLSFCEIEVISRPECSPVSNSTENAGSSVTRENKTRASENELITLKKQLTGNSQMLLTHSQILRKNYFRVQSAMFSAGDPQPT